MNTQQQAAATGHQRSRPTRFSISPSSPKNSDMKMISTTAIQVPRTCTQLIASVSIARPNR